MLRTFEDTEHLLALEMPTRVGTWRRLGLARELSSTHSTHSQLYYGKCAILTPAVSWNAYVMVELCGLCQYLEARTPPATNAFAPHCPL